MTRFRVPALLIVSLLAIVPICSAQVRGGTVEINPFAGYLFGGRFPAGSLAIFDTKVDVNDHATYGGGLGWEIPSKGGAQGAGFPSEEAFVTTARPSALCEYPHRPRDPRDDH